MCLDNQLNQWSLLKISSCLASLSHFLSEENKEQNSFFVPESETSAPDYWRESSGTHTRYVFVIVEQLQTANYNLIDEDKTATF